MTMGNSNQAQNPEDFEPNTVREKDSFCPIFGGVCPRDPKKCGRYQPFNIIEMKLNVPQLKTVYMCVDDSIRITCETILARVQGMGGARGSNPLQGLQGGGGRSPHGN